MNRKLISQLHQKPIKVPFGVQQAAYFHGIVNDYIKYGEVFYIDSIIGEGPVPGGWIGSKGNRGFQPLIDGDFYIVNQPKGGRRVLEMIGNVIGDFVQIIFKERKKS